MPQDALAQALDVDRWAAGLRIQREIRLYVPNARRFPIIVSRTLFHLPVIGDERAALRVKRPAIYVFLNKLGVLYVGQSNGAKGAAGRVAQHLAGDLFGIPQRRPRRLLVLWLRCDCALSHVERRMIRVLRPILNRQRPTGRRNVGHPGAWCSRCMRGEFLA